MSKRKPAMKSKRPKIAVKAQRAAQAVVRSPKDSRLPAANPQAAAGPPVANGKAQRQDSVMWSA
jgi:hypothetical protein